MRREGHSQASHAQWRHSLRHHVVGAQGLRIMKMQKEENTLKRAGKGGETQKRTDRCHET